MRRRVVTMAATAVLLPVLLAAPALAEVIKGSDGPDVIKATNGDDRIRTYAGRDQVVARQGDDRIWGGAGADELDAGTVNPLSLLRGVEMRVTAELGRTRLPVSHVLDLGPGAVVELDRVAGSPVDVLVNGTVIAHGEVVVIDEEYGVRITEIVGAEDR